MKSFRAFISEASAVPSNKAGWEKKYMSEKKKYEAAVRTLAPAARKKLDDLWQETMYTIMFRLIWNKGPGEISKPTQAKAEKHYAKWMEKSVELIAAAKDTMNAYAAKWANEKDPCKKMFQAKLFQSVSGSEPDTPKEASIWDQVFNYVSSPGNYGQVKSAYAELLRCKQTYKAQLDPSVKTVYRGLNITMKTALKLVSIKKLDQTAKIAAKNMIGHETKYFPRHPVESWSSSPGVAFNFAKGANDSGGVGYYEFSLAELKRDLAALKRSIAKIEKLNSIPKEKRDEDWKYKLMDAEDDIDYTIQDNINQYLASDSPVPVVYQIVPDEYCVMNPLFSNKIGHIVGVGAESEVTRIESKAVAATVWLPQELIDGARLVAEIQELLKQAKVKAPAIKVAVPVTLKKGK